MSQIDRTLKQKEIQFRAMRRGIKELDLVFGPFVEAHVERLSDEELCDLADLLNEHNYDLMSWFVDGKEPPQRIQTPLFNKVYTFFKRGSGAI